MPKITFLESPKKGFTKNKVKPFLSDPRKVIFGIVLKELCWKSRKVFLAAEK